MSEQENRGNALRSANGESQEHVARGSQPLARHRDRSATITAGIPPVASFSPPPTAPPVVTSLWNVQDQRDVVEEIVDTVQTPYIISRAEDIDAVIETAARTSTAGRSSLKHVKSTRSSRSQSVGAGAGAGADIDGYISGAPEGGSPTPRMSFAARLANGLRFHSGGKGAYSSPLMPEIADTRGVAASNASFAESFPAKTIVSYHVGLPAPVPAAAAETLPESYFPQTLTTASEDIDVLTNIGTEGPVDSRSGGATRQEYDTDRDVGEDEFDVDKVFQLADSSVSDTLGQDGQASTHSKAARPASADRWSRKGKGATVRAARASQSLPSSPVVTGPFRVHHAITASNTDRTTDIDDVLASDPEPNGLEGKSLPRTIVDAGDYVLLDSAATRPTPLSGRTSSVPILSSVDKSLDVKAGKATISTRGTLLSNSVDGILGQTQSPHTRPASKFEWTTPTHQVPAITHDDQLRYFRDDARASEDILAFVDMGSKISPTEEAARLKKSRRGRAQDIQTLVLAGEGSGAGSDSDTSISPESPGGDMQAPVDRRASSAGKKLRAAPRRVSYIEIDAYSVVAEHPTSPTVAVPTTTYAGSLDIDQLFAGESPSGWANRHAFPPGQHHAIERGEAANEGQAAIIVGEARISDPSQFSPNLRPASRRRSVSLGSANLEGAVAPALATAAAPRRLTCLDISHFMGIAETVEADYVGLPLGAGTKREVGKDTPHSSDIINYLSLGELPTTHEGDEQLQTPEFTVGPSGALSPTLLARQRRGSSMGQLNVGQKRPHAVPELHDWHPPTISRNPHDASGGTVLAVRLRRSLDELAIAHHFPKQGSFREMFVNNPSGWQRTPAVASSIVGVRPPKIDIDELVSALKSPVPSVSFEFSKNPDNSFTGAWKFERRWKESSLCMEAALEMGRPQPPLSYPPGEGPVLEA
ncbi:hypothetical protein HDU87_004107 [Geranomyces variabilis]|uniref:Uncharacterized protein n=1 Tax=Geranomyces variabilis TaxID=109894 RepID=A0AAD5TRP4_9FUNG|nr:hypothetical protein HDU87_004107 [Geranomyces variabilis]